MSPELSPLHLMLLALTACLFTSLCSGIGSLCVFFIKNVSCKVMDTLLGLTAGIMLAATCFSLILPAAEYTGNTMLGIFQIALWIMIGGIFLDLMDRYAPHERFLRSADQNEDLQKRKVWLFILAVTLHNLPEGMAVGMGFANGDLENGLTIALAIGLQNIPESLAVCMALLKEKYKPFRAFLIAFATGLVEPLGGLVGVGLVNLARPLLPLGLSFAAGAMLYVVCGQLLPESHQNGFKRRATYGFMLGFVLMMFFDMSLG